MGKDVDFKLSFWVGCLLLGLGSNNNLIRKIQKVTYLHSRKRKPIRRSGR